jgi:two-component system, chemotaxis family, chemotaxis protein CheY
MSKKVVLVGHCGADSSYLRMSVSAADRAIKVVAADDLEELHAHLKDGVDLLLLNRELGYGFDDAMGVELIRSLRATHPGVKMMLVSNYADAQAAAVAAGAVPGFGKRELGSARVAHLIRQALASHAVETVATPANARN